MVIAKSISFLPLARKGLRLYPCDMEEKKPAPTPGEIEEKPAPPKEIGGSKKPEPTRYGDWEIGGRCIDF